MSWLSVPHNTPAEKDEDKEVCRSTEHWQLTRRSLELLWGSWSFIPPAPPNNWFRSLSPCSDSSHHTHLPPARVLRNRWSSLMETTGNTKNGPRTLWTGTKGTVSGSTPRRTKNSQTHTFDTSEHPGNGPAEGTVSEVPGRSPEL